jgi:N-acetylglucosaminyldiphosphoundecaprenol N-acetyl-beta-D-mannosaminyltransferase
MKDRLKILNIWVDPMDREGALRKVKKFIEEGERPHAVFASNPEKNFSVPKDPLLYETFKRADLLIPDGIGVVLAARLLYKARIKRVPGAEFMEDICALAAREGHKVFFYGAKEEVNKKAVDILVQRFSGLRVAGRENGYLPEGKMPELIDRINASDARVLFLALGSPRQEKWFATHHASLKTVRVCQGIGGTLDTIVGTVKRAPKAWCKCNAEWLYRLLSEPRRIKRQKVLPVFAWQVFAWKVRSIFCTEGMK